jgi:hypothetical protein
MEAEIGDGEPRVTVSMKSITRSTVRVHPVLVAVIIAVQGTVTMTSPLARRPPGQAHTPQA